MKSIVINGQGSSNLLFLFGKHRIRDIVVATEHEERLRKVPNEEEIRRATEFLNRQKPGLTRQLDDLFNQEFALL